MFGLLAGSELLLLVYEIILWYFIIAFCRQRKVLGVLERNYKVHCLSHKIVSAVLEVFGF